MVDSADSREGGRQSKVSRLIDEHTLESLGPELERLWTADGDERLSLRALADRFNRRLLEAKMTDAGMQPLSGEVENTYRLLTDDNVSSADETRARRQLDRNGLDPDAVVRDFVSYQAIRTYLREHRGAEHNTSDRPRTAVESEAIRGLQGRTRTVTADKLEQLRSGDHVELGDFRVFTEVNVLCEDCGTRYEIGDLLERGGCECDR